MPISGAILKYGILNFELFILGVMPSESINELSHREFHWYYDAPLNARFSNNILIGIAAVCIAIKALVACVYGNVNVWSPLEWGSLVRDLWDLGCSPSYLNSYMDKLMNLIHSERVVQHLHV